ncbi:hypothetical protein [Priestia megaterium]|uniref:Uncharacterized protein n=1 Tax=Priestia megaterium TaxID=1404 RepID=A0A6M6E712_PRIMG|nr:hypothetical protein [Priestia megaterium]QJX81284.1 hypothetical protein FDZ14_34845 [Priestia megaterium]
MDILEQFGLNKDQAVLLFSMQRSLVQADIEIEKNKSLKQKKVEWLLIWENGIEDLLSQSSNRVTLIREELAVLEKCKDVVNNCENVKTPLYLILLELSLFVPYFPMEGFKRKLYERILMNEKIANYNLRRFSKFLDIDEEFINRYKKSFKQSVRSLSGFYTKMLIGAGLGAVLIAITAGLATPFVATTVAPAGLAGAAAINAGLAALGGGAIAAGGFGIAGGISVIVGGGSIFGALSGMALGAMLGNSADFALREGAKLEVIMRDIILLAQRDIRFAQEMIKGQKEVIKKLEIELTDLKFSETENKKQIKNLAKAIDYLRNSLKNSEKALLENAHTN